MLMHAPNFRRLLPLLLLAGSAQAAPAWVPIGPERGHVVSAAVGEDAVSVISRVGVMTADTRLSAWRRDPRFPPETRRIAYGPDGRIWAAPAGRLWRVEGELPHERTDLVLCMPDGSTAVDLETTGTGTLLMAVRGTKPGIVRLDASKVQLPAIEGEGENADPRCQSRPADTPLEMQARNAPYDFSPFEVVLPDVDPWRIATHGKLVLVGTVNAGLWFSRDDGRSFTKIMEDSPISAVAFRGDEPWAGLPDGRLVRGNPPTPVTYLALGAIQDIAALSNEVLVANRWGLARWTEAEGLVRLGLNLNEEQPGESVTGLWSISGREALVGTFRRGPLKWSEGALVPARTGFQSAVVGGAAADRQGRVILALMGTGVYLSGDSGRTWTPQVGGDAPVTDAVSVSSGDDSFVVVDFDGWTVRDASGRWTRYPGTTPTVQDGRRNGITAIGRDEKGGWWGIDGLQGLWSFNGRAWDRCLFVGAVRFDGAGHNLRLVATQGFYRFDPKVTVQQDCSAPWVPTRQDLPRQASLSSVRIEGEWMALPGELRYAGVKVADLPPDGASAIATRGDETLLGLSSREVMVCKGQGSAARCEVLSPPLPSPAQAIGWLPDGRIWVAEPLGTILAREETSASPTVRSWTRVMARRVGVRGLPDLERAPWSDEGRGSTPIASPPQGASGPILPPPPRVATPKETQAPGPWLHYLGLGALLLVAVFGLIALLVFRAVRLRRRREAP
jgi:hypothetical protein